MRHTLMLLVVTLTSAFAQTLTTDPQQLLLDDPIEIRVENFEPGTFVTLQAEMIDDAEVSWLSEATFEVQADGTVDVAAQVPQEGSYSSADPMGLFWSMAAQGDSDGFFVFESYDPRTVTLRTCFKTLLSA